MVTLSQEISALSPEQRRLLEARLRKKGIEISRFQILPRGEVLEHYPLSFAQQRLWFIHQLDPESSAYNVNSPMRVEGPLDARVLARALDAMVERHEVLRTTFSTIDGEPVQIVHPARPQPLAGVDLGALEHQDREREAVRLATRHGRQPFDLERGPPLRTTLLRLREDLHAFLLSMHHIVSDGWSMEIFARELLTLYWAFLRGRSSPLEPLPIQYVDFALWQRRFLQGERAEGLLGYWKKQLRGIPASLGLPFDRPRPPYLTHHGGAVSVILSPPDNEAARSLARREKVTLFAILLATFQTLLWRISSEEDVVVGTPIANRNRQETEGLVGFFVNTLVLRGDLSGNPSFGTLLRRVWEVNGDAGSHQDLPFERLVEELHPERSLNRTPLYQVSFAFQAEPIKGPEAKALGMTEQPAENPVAQFDLALSLTDAYEILGDLVYNVDLFDRTTVRRLERGFQNLLTTALANPDRALAELTLWSAAERHQVLMEWNSPPGLEEPPAMPLHRLFEAQVRRHPEAPAVSCAGMGLTYGELDARADRLARSLRHRKVGPETLVGLCLERSLEMVVVILGVLKAGGAYLPLDPSHPRERLAFLVEDSRASLVLTHRRLADRLPAGRQVLPLDGLMDGDDPAEDGSGTPPPVLPDHPAYVIYTSGSTGRPKGVLVTHRNVVRLFTATADRFRFGAGDVWTLFHSYAFDFSVWEIWGALLHGGRLVVVPHETSRSPEVFHRLLAQEGVTVLNQTPSAFRQLMRADAAAEGRLALRRVIFGGEALDLAALEPWFARHREDEPRLVNMYGITETTVHVTARPLSASDAAGDRGSLIGCPLADLRIHLLDPDLRPVPLGSRGEISVGGAGLTRGYLGRPGLTAERFVPEPGGGRPGERLYRSGDLARRWPDGDLAYLGRRDHQVKVRGFRIEPGEIEAQLLRLPAVREAVVMLSPETSPPRLAAFLVLADGASVSTRELRAELAGRLPDYMIPAVLFRLDALPLTANGKLDRAALGRRALDGHRLESGRPHVAPGNAVERTLAAIWGEVLKIAKIGSHDNFFELGGDSIQSLQVISRAARQGIRLTPRQIFEHQTIAELAAAAHTAEPVVSEQGLVTGPVPLTPIQQSFFEQEWDEPHHFNQALMLAVHPELYPGLLPSVVRHLVRHHDALRLRFARRTDGWHQRCADPGEAPAETARIDLSALAGRRLPAAYGAAARQAQASLDLERGPAVRAVWFEPVAGKRGRLLLIIHHLLVDGVSWRLLVEDLGAVWERLAAGEPPRLPPKTTSYKAWAERLAEHVRSGALDAELDHWLAAGTTPAALPMDALEGENTVSESDTVAASLDSEETRQLLQDVPATYRTRIDEVLLSALTLGFGEWSGSPALTVDLEGHGREAIFEDLDLSRTVGWFTSIYPVSLDLTAAGGPGEALKTVKEELRTLPGRGIGYGLLRYLSDEATRTRLAERAAPRVSFNYLGHLDRGGGPGRAGEEPRLVMAPEPVGPLRSPRGRRRYLLELDGSVRGGRLNLAVTYSERFHRGDSIEALLGHVLTALRRLIRHCLQPDAGGYTPSDFPLAGLDQATLDRSFANDRRVEDVYPLTSTQQGMLFHRLYDPSSLAYFVQASRVVTGELDVRALERAWEEVVASHPVLRTSFVWQGLDEPLQIVWKTVEVPWEHLDWRHKPVPDQETDLEAFVLADRERGFDLERAPLLRLALIRLDHDLWFLSWSHHHIVLDGWSGPLLRNEVYARYLSQLSGRPVELHRAPPFRDYLAWLRRQDLGEAEAFWRRELAGFDSPVSLGLEPAAVRPRRHPERFTGYPGRLSPRVSDRLRHLASRHQLTLNTLIQAAWALLLSRMSGRFDVLFGATVSGRSAPLEGIESMLGLFINTLPVRARVEPQVPLVDWIRRFQERQVMARQFEHSPLMWMQRWSEVEPTRLLFESIVVFENYPIEVSFLTVDQDAAEPPPPLRPPRDRPAGSRPAGDGPGPERASSVRQFERTSYPLTLLVIPDAEFLRCELGVDRRLFEEAAALRLLRTLERICEGMVEQPEGRIREVPVLSDAERRQILVDWNRTAVPRSGAALVHELFEAQAERTPDAVALVGAGEMLSYRGLDQRANRLARHLLGAGVGPEKVVGLCLERSPDMVAAVFAVLKAGGAYLPLDPEIPRQRLAFLLADARVPVILTQRTLADRLPSSGARRLTVEDVGSSPARGAEDNPPRIAGPRNLAYLIYTSGSTGRPKAVMVEHRSLADYSLVAAETAELGPSDRVLQFASLAFDTSAEEIYPCLIRGATLVLRDERMLEFPRFLLGCRRERLTVLDLPTAYWHELVREIDREGLELPPSLRWVILGGEKVLPEPVAVWHAHAGDGAWLVNTYGPTETTVVATLCLLAEPPVERPTATGGVWPEIPIGRPRPNARVYVFDRYLEPAMPGVAGELYIGGLGLARGYLGRPGLTAEKFVPEPQGEGPPGLEAGARLYRTGDRVRYREDGQLEFLGRYDQQVKVRGFRIEPGEIEAVLARHGAVRAAAVIARARSDSSPSGGTATARLVAYFVPEPRAPRPEPAELRDYLGRQLPGYMVPATFVELAELPRLASGKVDRQALPEPEESGPDEDFVAPRNELETELATIWEDVFERRPIGVHDNFFELGGDSLVALRLMTRVHGVLDRELPLSALFESGTIAELGALLAEPAAPEAWTPLVAIQRRGSHPPLVCVHAAGGEALAYRDLARYLGPEQPVYALGAGPGGPDEPDTTIEGMAARYIAALRGLPGQGPGPLLGWSLGGVVAYEMARQLDRQGQPVPRVILLDSLTPERLPTWTEAQLIVAFGIDIGGPVPGSGEISEDEFEGLGREGQLRLLLGRGKQAGLLAPEMTLEELTFRWRFFAAFVRAVQSYVPPPYGGRVLLFRAGEGPPAEASEATLGWERYVAGEIDVEWSPGSHGKLLEQPYVRPLASKLNRYLRTALVEKRC